MKKIIGLLSLVVFLGGIFLLSGCTNNMPVEKAGDEKINVMVSILPQVDFVERIGGDKVSVNEMIPPGFSPATYDPSPEQLKKMQTADIYFRIGHIPFEKAQMEKISGINPEMEVVDTSEGVALQQLTAHSHEEEEEVHEDEHEEEEESEHGEEHEDSHNHEAGDDPHIWLSPKLVKIQAENIYNSLVDFSPENKEYFLSNYNQFISDLDELDSKLETTFEPIKDKSILVFHPAFGYLASAYGFEQEAIEIEGKDPSPEHLKDIIDEAKADDINVIFVQKQFSTKSAESVAKEIGGAVVQIDPLAKDYFDNLEKMSDTIVNALQ